MRLKDKVSLVTGGAGGIGKQIALTLAKEGSKVAIVDIKREEGVKTEKQLGKLTDSTFIHSDISKVANIVDSVNRVHKIFSRIDVLVNNAGISIRTPVHGLTEEQWDKITTINLKTAYFFSKEVCKIMMEQNSGKIINIASTRGIVADETHVGYSITKAGIVAMTKNFALNLAKYNINVNTVSPGYVLTPMTKHNLENNEFMEWLESRVPLGRFIEMQEIADAVLFLALNDSKAIVGQNIIVDGGWTIQQ